ncbi:MAG: hypothetical protein IPN17_16885 [Deltaproteobacteria bacterium]|jgi:hypothetical protein|nr:hypothetical protein [Deltaproteobacteria bacterium]MBK8693910.1 hypothetical protein [Deltaproteobacteria bacterium]MBP6830517.1 hypothetical protein [Deltaproteobacteria bacterium]
MNHDIDQSQPATAGARNTKAVYMITEREGARSIWTRVGSAWVNRDGSTTLRLDALPLSGTLQVRDPEPRPLPTNGGAQ